MKGNTTDEGQTGAPLAKSTVAEQRLASGRRRASQRSNGAKIPMKFRQRLPDAARTQASSACGGEGEIECGR